MPYSIHPTHISQLTACYAVAGAMPYASDVQIRANTWARALCSCEYVRIRAQHARGCGRLHRGSVRHVFGTYLARIPRIWGHVFCDSDPRIFRVLITTLPKTLTFFAHAIIFFCATWAPQTQRLWAALNPRSSEPVSEIF